MNCDLSVSFTKFAFYTIILFYVHVCMCGRCDAWTGVQLNTPVCAGVELGQDAGCLPLSLSTFLLGNSLSPNWKFTLSS